MEKNLRGKINRWIEFSESIKKMYLCLIEHEQSDNFDKEYYNLLYLMPKAIEIEKKITDDLNINASNWRMIKTVIDCPDDYLEKILEEKSNSFEILRRSNILDNILLYRHNNFFFDKEPTNIFELINNTNYRDELNNLKYADIFLNHVTINFIAIIQKYINETDDQEIKNYLIYLKYALISTTPSYEITFFELKGQPLPTININTNYPDIEGYNTEAIDDINRYNLREAFKSDLVQAFCIDNNIIDNLAEKKLLYRILALNKARLISLRDDEFISTLEKAIDEIRPINPDYSHVNNLIDSMFKDAHELVKKDYYIPKKIRN